MMTHSLLELPRPDPTLPHPPPPIIPEEPDPNAEPPIDTANTG